MITLYHCVSARSFRPLWTMEECGIAYELKMLAFPPRYAAREYLQVNPLGTVPALFDDQVQMTESAAMCQYLVARYGPAAMDVKPQEADFGAYLNWLHFGEATLTFPQTLILRYGRFEAPERRSPQVEQDYRRWFLARLRAVDAVLSTQDYLCAGRFTAADISVGYALMLAEFLEMEADFPAAVRTYWQRLKGRDGYRAALKAQHDAAVAQGIAVVHAPLTTP